MSARSLWPRKTPVQTVKNPCPRPCPLGPHSTASPSDEMCPIARAARRERDRRNRLALDRKIHNTLDDFARAKIAAELRRRGYGG